MRRIFIIVGVLSALMTFIAGGSVFWIEVASTASAERAALNHVAQNLANHLDTQLATLQQSVDGVAQSADVIAALASASPQLIQTTETKLQPLVPYNLRLRLLSPNISDPDQSSTPHMGFGDVEMVRATLSERPKPVIQGEGEHRHLAITSPVIVNQRIVGVVLASLKPNLVQDILTKTPLEHGAIELKQEQISLGSLGNTDSKNDDPQIIPLKEGRWQLNVWPDVAGASDRMLWASIVVSATVSLIGLIFFIGYRKLTAILRQDQSSVLKAAKEIMHGKHAGNYPIQLDEMLPMVTSLAQFKRILDQDNAPLEPSPTKDRDFFDESFDIDFLEDSPLPQTASQPDSPKAAPIKLPTSNDFDRDDLAEPPAPTVTSTIAPEQHAIDEFVAMPPPVEEALIPESWDLNGDAFMSSMDTETNLPPANVITTPEPDHKPASIFRDSTIRGIVGVSLTPEIMTLLGNALASEARQLSIKNIVVARDNRASSVVLADALISGITEAGCDVLDIGMVTTSVLYFVAHHSEGRTGIMVTGGNSADDYNGLKWIINDEMPTSQTMQALQRRFESREFFRTGSASVERNTLFSNEYIGSIADETHIVRPMNVVFDCAGGAASELGPSLLKTIGCDVRVLQDGPSGLEALSLAVKSQGADLGVYLPGDGSRMTLVDSSGRIIWPDRQMMLFARDVLASRSGGQVLHDLGCSKHLPEQIKKRGGRPLICKSNPTLIRTILKQTGAALAGTFSGHLFFNDRWLGFDDGLYAAARMIEILSDDMRASAELFDDLPDSESTPGLFVPLHDGEAQRLIEQLFSQGRFDGVVDNSDGMKVELNDAWGLVRCSTTQPGLVMRFEADTPKALQRIQSQFKHEMLTIKPDISLPF